MTEITAPVHGYRLVVPADWHGIDLEPDKRHESVAALVNRQFARAPQAKHLKVQAERELLSRAAAAHDAGGTELFLSLQQVSGIPVPASLAIFLLPPDDDRAVAAGQLAGLLGGQDRRVSIVDLPAGRSVRVLRSGGQSDRPDRQANQPDSVTHEVFVPVPGGDWWLLLAFATPVGPLAEPLSKLFDAICATLRWDR